LTECQFYGICHRATDESSRNTYCILHSDNPDKDQKAFDDALTEHRRQYGHDYRNFIFPGPADFSTVEFADEADFSSAKLKGYANFRFTNFAAKVDFDGVEFERVDFSGTKFAGDAFFQRVNFNVAANFNDAKFLSNAYFGGIESYSLDFSGAGFFKSAGFGKSIMWGKTIFAKATFAGKTVFKKTTFLAGADFTDVAFAAEADFVDARFKGLVGMADSTADFGRATFTQGANFTRTTFGGRTDFRYARFQGLVLFLGGEGDKIFQGAEVDFRDVITDPLDALIIRDADLQKCRFLGTDLRKAELTNVTWPKLGKRDAVYDDIASMPMGNAREPAHLERLYRELKQNCEDRHDYEGASDFHYGEKEMRRQNPKTAKPLRWVLWLYRWISGYGEDYVRALECVLGLAVVCAFIFWCLGFCAQQAVFYSLRVMLHLKPEAIAEPVGWGVGFIFIFESILGPVLIGLFGLALRQRLKR
jgi:uncharacterized protein YjbI with pentapeptide repeats